MQLKIAKMSSKLPTLGRGGGWMVFLIYFSHDCRPFLEGDILQSFSMIEFGFSVV